MGRRKRRRSNSPLTVTDEGGRVKLLCDHPGCGKSFVRPEHLTRHKLTHNEYTFTCDQCGRLFSRNDLLQKHIYRHNRWAQREGAAATAAPADADDDAAGRPRRHPSDMPGTAIPIPGMASGNLSMHEYNPPPKQGASGIPSAVPPVQDSQIMLPSDSTAMSPSSAAAAAAAAAAVAAANGDVSTYLPWMEGASNAAMPGADDFVQSVNMLFPRFDWLLQGNGLFDQGPMTDSMGITFESSPEMASSYGRADSDNGSIDHQHSAVSMHSIGTPTQSANAGSAPMMAPSPSQFYTLTPNESGGAMVGAEVSHERERDQFQPHIQAHHHHQPPLQQQPPQHNHSHHHHHPPPHPPPHPSQREGAGSAEVSADALRTLRVQDRMDIPQQLHDKFLALLPARIRKDPRISTPYNCARIIESAFKSGDLLHAVLHQPTFSPSKIPATLLLSLVSFGLLTSGDSASYGTGLEIHSVARRILFDPDVSVSAVDMSWMQAMLLNHVAGTFLARRADHEKAHVMHGQLVTLARRCNFLSDEPMKTTKSAKTESHWSEWARRESIKRLALYVYILDIQQAALFGHQKLMSIEDLRLQLPCDDVLWSAATFHEWGRLVIKGAKSSGTSGGGDGGLTPTAHRGQIRDLLLAFFRNAEQHSDSGALSSSSSSSITTNSASSATILPSEIAIPDRPMAPLAMLIIVHGFVDLILMFQKKRDAFVINPLASSPNAAQPDDYDKECRIMYNMLASLNTVIHQKAPSTTTSGPFRELLMDSTLVVYHLCYLMLGTPMGDLEMAAGAPFTHGRAVSHDRAVAALTRLVATHISDTTLGHALSIVDIATRGQPWAPFRGSTSSNVTSGAATPTCDDWRNVVPPPGERRQGFAVPSAVYLAALTIWAYCMGLSHRVIKQNDSLASSAMTPGSRANAMMPPPPWLGKNGGKAQQVPSDPASGGGPLAERFYAILHSPSGNSPQQLTELLRPLLNTAARHLAHTRSEVSAEGSAVIRLLYNRASSWDEL